MLREVSMSNTHCALRKRRFKVVSKQHAVMMLTDDENKKVTKRCFYFGDKYAPD